MNPSVSHTAVGNSAVRPGLAKRLSAWIDRANPYNPERLSSSGLIPVVLEESETRKYTFRIVFVALSAFMLWASVAPLDNGVHMTGTVVVQGHRKAVQHPVGGVVTELRVHEGQQVREGDVLLRLNPLGTVANLDQTELEYLNLMVTESRLLAERIGEDAIRWIPELSDWAAGDQRLIQAKGLQQQLFATRRQDLATQQSILKEQIAAAEKQLRDLNEVLGIKREQLDTLSVDAKNNRELAREGFVSASRANEVERARSELLAAITNLGTEISRTQSALAANRLQLIQQRVVLNKEIDTQLAETQKNRKALKSRVQSHLFDRDSTELKAPISGTVLGLKVFTEGGVVRAGDVLMEVVPADGALIVDAKVPPQYIDKVRTGLTAFTRLTAFNVNTTPVVEGDVVLVAPDRITSPDGSTDFYPAQISLRPASMAQIRHLQIQPGMPVEVVVKTGERTFLSYLLKPLTDRTAQAFKDPF